jgi:hypothetical protein
MKLGSTKKVILKDPAFQQAELYLEGNYPEFKVR